MAKLSALSVGLLVIGLVIGAGIAATAIPPRTVTSTQTQSVVLTSPQSTTTTVSTTTIIATLTRTQTTTQTTTQIVTKATTGATLVTNGGSGNANSQPFTATTANVQIVLNLTATGSLTYAAAYWYIKQVSVSYSTCKGNIQNQQGSFVDYCYGLTIGTNYYIEIDGANVNWQVSVKELH